MSVNDRPRRGRGAAGMVLLAALCATTLACGGGEATTSSIPGAAADDTAGGADTATAPEQVTIATGGKVLTLDPDKAVDATSVIAVHLIAGTLYEVDAQGDTTPSLASDGRASADRLTWTFTLRPGLRFSDGSPLTARDVAASVDRAMRDEANAYLGLFSPMRSVRAVGDDRVVIEVRRPYPSLPTVLAEPPAMVMPADAVRGGPSDRFFDAPVSAGPYKVVEWSGGDTFGVVRNDEYAGAAVEVPRLTIRTTPDINTRLAQLKSGQVDFVPDLNAGLLEQVTGEARASVVSMYGFANVLLRNTNAPLDEVGVRQAISKAIDREQLNDVVYRGRVQTLAGFWPSTMTGYDPSVSTARDVEGARAALRGTSCESGCRLELIYNAANTTWEQTALIVRQNLKDVGIEVTPEKVDSTTLLARLPRGDYEMAINGLYDYADVPDGVLAYGLDPRGGLQANYSGFEDPRVPGLIRRADESEGEEQLQALREIDELFVEQAPYVNLWDWSAVTASRLPEDVVALTPAGLIEVGREGR